MKTNLLLVALLFSGLLNAQTTADFENFSLGVDTFLNGSDLQGGFASGNLFLSNTYDSQFNSWFGNAISTKTDVTTAGFTNEFSSISGAGNGNSLTYGVAYMSYLTNSSVIQLTGAAAGGGVEGFYINNSTYAYLSMLNGDGVAKKFGGASGDDQDFFLLTVQKYLGDSLYTDKVEFYLADYRFSDNADDYIIQDWTYVDLSSLGNADSLSFSLSSSDVGQFGMNTPAYFCFDDFTTKDEVVSGIRNIEAFGFTAYPNPVQDKLNIQNTQGLEGQISLYNQLGQLVISKDLSATTELLDFTNLPMGVYFLNIKLNNGTSLDKILVRG